MKFDEVITTEKSVPEIAGTIDMIEITMSKAIVRRINTFAEQNADTAKIDIESQVVLNDMTEENSKS